MTPAEMLRRAAVDATTWASQCRALARELLELSRSTDDPSEARDLEYRAIKLGQAATSSTAVAVAAARAMAQTVIERMQAETDAERRVDPVELRARLRAIVGGQGAQ